MKGSIQQNLKRVSTIYYLCQPKAPIQSSHVLDIDKYKHLNNWISKHYSQKINNNDKKTNNGHSGSTGKESKWGLSRYGLKFDPKITLGEVLTGVCFVSFLYWLNKTHEDNIKKQEELSKIKTQIAYFLRKKGAFNAEDIQQIEEKVMSPLNKHWRDYIKGYGFDGDYASCDFKLDFLKLLILWADGKFIHHENIKLVQEIIKFEEEIIENCIKHNKALSF